jgi:hypothetical protein
VSAFNNSLRRKFFGGFAIGLLLFCWESSAWAKARHFQPTGRIVNYSQDPNARGDIGIEYPPEVSDYNLSWGPHEDPDINEVRYLSNPLDDSRFDSYNLIVVVNKRSNREHGPGQTIRVFHRQHRYINDGLVYYWKTSTGAAGMDTPSGFYRPYAFSSMYWSTKYKGAMHWSVFITPGIALHSVFDTQSVLNLGNPASHGCIRLQEYRAEHLFHLVGHSGYGLVDVLHSRTGNRSANQPVNSYKTMIIVI